MNVYPDITYPLLKHYFSRRKKIMQLYLFKYAYSTNPFSCLYHKNRKQTKACLFGWLVGGLIRYLGCPRDSKEKWSFLEFWSAQKLNCSPASLKLVLRDRWGQSQQKKIKSPMIKGCKIYLRAHLCLFKFFCSHYNEIVWKNMIKSHLFLASEVEYIVTFIRVRF